MRVTDDDTDDVAVIDNVQIAQLPSAVNSLPKDDSEFVAIERTSAENDLVFAVTDDEIVKVDVLFAPDPNLSGAYTIVDGMSVSPGPYTITLETQYPQDLDWSTEYFWQVLAYEPNGMDFVLHTRARPGVSQPYRKVPISGMSLRKDRLLASEKTLSFV